jgi:hypothetical protein
MEAVEAALRVSAVIVELIGPPGSGKSTLAQAAAARLGIRSVNMTGYFDVDGRLLTRLEVRRGRAVAFVRQPTLTAMTYRCWRKEGSGLALSWMVNLQRRTLAARRLARHPGVFLLEEGPINALCLAIAARGEAWQWQKVARHITLADAVVRVQVPAPVAAERIATRAGILSELPEEELALLLSRYETAVQTVRGYLPGPGLEVDSLQSIDDNAERIARFIDDRARQAEIR